MTDPWLQETSPGSFAVRGALISPTTGKYITTTPTRNPDEPEKKMSDKAIPTYVCEFCRMKLPSIIHAQSHEIVHGFGHEPKIAYLDATGTSVAP